MRPCNVLWYQVDRSIQQSAIAAQADVFLMVERGRGKNRLQAIDGFPKVE